MKSVRICPKCGSSSITSSSGSCFGIEGFKNICNDCGFEGVVPELDEDKVDEFRKELK